jgi:hypothetical protein
MLNKPLKPDLIVKGQVMGHIMVFLNITEGSAPKTDLGQEICLAYHPKGGCYKDCAGA